MLAAMRGMFPRAGCYLPDSARRQMIRPYHIILACKPECRARRSCVARASRGADSADGTRCAISMRAPRVR